MKEKSGRSLWITPPSPDMTSSFRAFLALGWKLRGELNKVPSLVEDNQELEKVLSRLRAKPKKEEEERIQNRSNSETGPSLQQEMINLLKLPTFPFLEKHFIPLSARVVIAILSATYVERSEQATFEHPLKIFRLINLPIGSYKDEGERLVNYALKKHSYLDVAENQDSTGYLFTLSHAGYQDLVGVELKGIFTEKMANPRGMYRHPRKNDGSSKDETCPDFSKDSITPKVTLHDVVLDKDFKIRLAYVAKQYLKEKKYVFKILFWGPPGTGKTHTAMSLAGEIKRTIIMMDLSKVYGKYTGETERNFTSYFDRAEKEKAILLMDEADSFFKQRSEDNPSWENRYVNQAIMLLERRPISVILCTNLFDALDNALLRRLDEVLEFKLPNKEERAEIWKKELSRHGLSDGIEMECLREIELSGGLIANAVKKAQRIKVVTGGIVTINALLLEKLALEEKRKMGVGTQVKRIYGFGG